MERVELDKKREEILAELKKLNEEINDGTTMVDLIGFDPDEKIEPKVIPNPYVESGRRDEHLGMIDKMVEDGLL